MLGQNSERGLAGQKRRRKEACTAKMQRQGRLLGPNRKGRRRAGGKHGRMGACWAKMLRKGGLLGRKCEEREISGPKLRRKGKKGRKIGSSCAETQKEVGLLVHTQKEV